MCFSSHGSQLGEKGQASSGALVQKAPISSRRDNAFSGGRTLNPPEEELFRTITDEEAALTSREQRFAKAAELMKLALSKSTGLKDRDITLVVYWTLATHSLPQQNTFPLMTLIGKMGTGKSQTLAVMNAFAFRPVRLSLRGMTAATIRDKFAECLDGTAIVEEADDAWKDRDMTFEHLLSDRYQRASAAASHKQKSGDNWVTATKNYFGATALHRRTPFSDAALDGRTVRVRFRANNARQYREFSEQDAWIVQGKRMIDGLAFEPPAIEQPKDVAARVFNTYRPLMSTARFCGHESFIGQIIERLMQETLELNEAQSTEPEGLVLGAIVGLVFADGSPKFEYIKVSTLNAFIWNHHRIPFQPRQVATIARDLGFIVKPSHGVTVVVPSPVTLLKACEECEYKDEAIEKLRKEVFEKTRSVAQG